MCGISGIIDIHGRRDVDHAMLVRMTQRLEHRGPDGQGLHLGEGVGFGHRRLAIIDIAGGKQPFVSSGGRTAVTFNGEIYNYRQLARDVEADGRSLQTQSDTEILAELLDVRGADVLPHLNGMFAFAAHSPRDDSFVLARDRLGEKPLYYHITANGWLLFASEIDALLVSGMVPDVLDETAVADYFLYGYVPDPKTIYRGVHKLPPGHYLSFRRGQTLPEVRRWWTLTFAPDSSMTYESAQEELIPLVDRAVRDQMVADVPISAFLSGGVDSSAIVSAMSAQTDTPVTTCSIGFHDSAFDERGFARKISSLYHTRHHEHQVSVDAASLIPLIASVYGEPFADTSALPTLLVCAMARQHATVALSGDGGDEVFAGYDRYSGILREALVRRFLPKVVRERVIAPVGAVYPPLPNAPRPLRLRTGLQAIGESAGAGYARAVSAILPDTCRSLLSRTMDGYQPQTIVEAIIQAAGLDDPVLQAQAADFATWLPGRMLVKVDRAAMANGLEVRPPLLDHRLVEWAARLPRRFKCAEGVGKRIFKAALEPHLPDEILYRPKQGFGSPVDRWFALPGSPLMLQLRNTAAWKESGFLNVEHVLRMAAAHEKGQQKCGQALWSVLMFDAFLTRRPLDRGELATAVSAAQASSDTRILA